MKFNKAGRRRRKSESSSNGAEKLDRRAEKEREFHRESVTLLARHSDSTPGTGKDPGKPELK